MTVRPDAGDQIAEQAAEQAVDAAERPGGPARPARPGPARAGRRGGTRLAVALLTVGGAAVLLAAVQTWIRATVHRGAPLPDLSVRLPGRAVEPAVLGLGVVAVAAALAVLATSGVIRRLVGVVVVLAGLAVLWRSATGVDVSAGRILQLVGERQPGAVLTTSGVEASRVVVWPVLAAVAGLVIAVAGVYTAAAGHRWAALSNRYEAPVAGSGTPPRAAAALPEDVERERMRTDAALWHGLDRGEDPTSD